MFVNCRNLNIIHAKIISTMNILYEDNDLIIINKPAGLAVQTSHISQTDLQSQLLAYLAKNNTSSTTPYLGIVHRLDQPVAGIICFGKNEKTTAALSKQLQNNTAHKEYLALIECDNNIPSGIHTLTDFLVKVPRDNIAKIVSPKSSGAKKAILHYEEITDLMKYSSFLSQDKIDYINCHSEIKALRIIIETGRFHQIRCQLQGVSMPIIGDIKYGGSRHNELAKKGEIALFASQLNIIHPSTKNQMIFKL